MYKNIMESKWQSTLVTTTSSLLNDNFYPSQNSISSTTCIECHSTIVSYCSRCKVHLCNIHVQTHLEYKTCIDCGEDTCIEMMFDEDSKSCFICGAKTLITELKHKSDELYDESALLEMPTNEINHIRSTNIHINRLYHGTFYPNKY